MKKEEVAIRVDNVSKLYKLYDKPIERVKESVNLFGRKYHKEFYALNDISFSIKKGETVGIIGKNGSGKSTLLKMITGVLTPSSGKIEVNGRISALLELGAGFNPELTGIENVYLNGTIMGYSREEMDQRLDEILAFADIGEFVYQPVKTYSSGMFVRLAFSVAINVDPDILIVDEALSVGDVRFQQKCYAKFQSFQDAGKTILFVTHSLDSVKRYCSRAVLINNGRLLKDDKPKEVVNAYLKVLRGLDSPKISNVNNKMDIKTTNNIQDIVPRKEQNDLYSINDSIWYNPNEYSYGTGEAVFTKVGLFDESGNISTNFEVGSKMKIVVEFTAKEDIDVLYFGYGIRNLQGVDLFVFNGTPLYDHFEVENIESGKMYKIGIKQTICLVPNDYTLTFSLTKLVDGEFIPTQIRYDVLLYKVLGQRNYAGMFYQDVEMKLEV